MIKKIILSGVFLLFNIYVYAGNLTIQNSGLSINNTDYGASWENANISAPSRNVVWKKIETLAGGHDPVTATNTTDINILVTGQDLNATINSTLKSGWNNDTIRFAIYNITTSHDILIPPNPSAITFTKFTANVVDGTNVTGHWEDCGANGQLCNRWINSTDWEIINATELEVTSFENATIPAGNWTKWNTTTVTGAVSCFAAGMDYTK